MFEYARLYEQFRPARITKNNTYFGTVNKMEAIYFNLFKYLDADLLQTFSHSSATDLFIQFNNASKQSHNDIDWDMMIDDIREIDRAILITMEEHAVDLYCILGSNTPSYIWRLVKGLILRYAETIKDEDIDFRNDSVFIKNKEIVFANNWQLSTALFELDKNK
jgi:hypothetical protein